MRFVCIHHGNFSPNIVRLFREACEARQIEFVTYDPTTFDYASYVPSPKVTLLYTVSTTPATHTLQHYLMNDRTVTFFRYPQHAFSELGGIRAATIHEQAGIPMPKTVYPFTRDRELLRQAAAGVGGFPLVVKVTGSSHGVGVIKVDSLPGFFSLMDFLYRKREKVMVRQFIETSTSARLVVLNGQVIDSIEYHVPDGDFRSNCGSKPSIRPAFFSNETQAIACRAVEVLDLEFGGVDVLFDSQGQPYVTEVNFPCNFSRAQLLTKIDIAGMMVDHLVAKAQRLYVPHTLHAHVAA